MTRSATPRRFPRQAAHRPRLAALLAGLLLVAGCADPEVQQRQPASDTDGVQATGRLDGSRVAISYGEPEVVFGDCDPGDGLDRDLCMVSRTIDGLSINIVIENPSALLPGERIDVRDDPCVELACDEVREHAVVDLRLNGEQRRVTGGSLNVLEAGQRFAAEFRFLLTGGDELTGEFDVAPPAAPVVPSDPTGS